MMLLAFTWRPLRSSQTSHGKLLASWVRAWPRARVQAELVDDGASPRGIFAVLRGAFVRVLCAAGDQPGCTRVTPSPAPADGAPDQGVEVAVAMGQQAQQHRQADPATSSMRPGSIRRVATLHRVAP